jgi:hypothetical protein
MSDKAYTTFSYTFQNGGLIARDVFDKMRPGGYLNVDNLTSREENSLSTRYGCTTITAAGNVNSPLDSSVQSLSKMQGISSPFRYGKTVGGRLWRRAAVTPGAYSTIATAMSANPVSMFPYRPTGSGTPWMFVADDTLMLKDNGSLGTAQKWGISPPQIPAQTQIGDPQRVNIERFNEVGFGSFTFAGGAAAVALGSLSQGVVATAVGTPGLQTVAVKTAAITNFARAGGIATITMAIPYAAFIAFPRIAVTSAAADPSFNTASAVITATGVNTISYINPGPNVGAFAGTGTVSPIPNIQVGMLLDVDIAGNEELVYVTTVTATGFTANFTLVHAGNFAFTVFELKVNVTANSQGTITKPATLNLSQLGIATERMDDTIVFYAQVDDPQNIVELKIAFDVGDGTFTQDYYWKSVRPPSWQPAATGALPSSLVQTQRVFNRAGGGNDVRQLGVDDPSLLPTDNPILQSLQPREMKAGLNANSQIVARLGEFVPVGQAGGPNNNWANVVAWRITITTSPNTASTVVLGPIACIGGAGEDSFAGQPYDYVYTYYNQNTGDESNPSQLMISANALAVQRLPIAVTYSGSADAQVTHVRFYRRGGTLTNAFYFVDQVVNGSGVFTDNFADVDIEAGNTAVFDADVPVTTLLPVPVNTTLTAAAAAGATTNVTIASSVGVFVNQLVTIGTGATQEVCVVQATSAGHMTVYCQYAHQSGEKVTATARRETPMNLMAIAFDRAWLAGDANNPHVLYYSTSFNPESVPPENFVEVGSPDAPIMAVIELRGLLYVFTTKRVYQVLGAGSAVPVVIPTGVKHGLVSNFGWAAAENIIYYISYDGIYVFEGTGSQYLSEPIEWLLKGFNYGPVQALDTAKLNTVQLAYANHQVFVLYADQASVQRRLVYNEVYQRWRNDDPTSGNVTAQYFEEDTGTLLIGRSTGMLFQDLNGDYDSGGFSAGNEVKNPIAFTLQTQFMDQSDADPTNAKKFKVYNEVTLDWDTGNTGVTVTALFDGGLTSVALGFFSQNGRGQTQIKINNGAGQQSQNIALKLVCSGSVTTPVTLYKVHVRAVVQAEYRTSWDTWWIGEGSDEWKLYKQIFAEYAALSTLTVNAYTEGNMATPVFTFTLPATETGENPGVRQSLRVRFPATKCKLFRLVATSAGGDCQIYDDTQLEYKQLGANKGYQRGRISP